VFVKHNRPLQKVARAKTLAMFTGARAAINMGSISGGERVEKRAEF